jgi:hypothetical protein
LSVFAANGTAFAAPQVVWRGTLGDKPTPVYVEPLRRYRLDPQHSGKCLDIAAWSQVDGAQVRQWTCDSATVGWPPTNQEFWLDYVQGSGLDVVVRPASS